MYSSKLKYIICFILLIAAVGVGGYFLIPKFKNLKNDNQKIALVSLSALDSDSDGLSDKKELELGTNQYNQDSDGDGYFDAEEVKSGHDPLKIESRNLLDDDNDGLSNEEEKQYGTSIKNKDSDSDGYSDGMEIAYGHNPLKPDFSVLEQLTPENMEAQKLKETIPAFKQAANAKTADELEQSVNAIAKQGCPFCNKSYSKISIDTGNLKNTDFNIKSDAPTKAEVEKYVYVMGVIVLKALPFSLLDSNGVEDYISGFDPFDTTLVNENSRALSSALSNLRSMEVPNDEEIIAWHKKFFSFLITAENLSEKWKSGQVDLTQAAGIFKDGQGMAIYALTDLSPSFEKIAKKYNVTLPTTQDLYGKIMQ